MGGGGGERRYSDVADARETARSRDFRERKSTALQNQGETNNCHSPTPP